MLQESFNSYNLKTKGMQLHTTASTCLTTLTAQATQGRVPKSYYILGFSIEFNICSNSFLLVAFPSITF